MPLMREPLEYPSILSELVQATAELEKLIGTTRDNWVIDCLNTIEGCNILEGLSELATSHSDTSHAEYERIVDQYIDDFIKNHNIRSVYYSEMHMTYLLQGDEPLGAWDNDVNIVREVGDKISVTGRSWVRKVEKQGS